MPGRRSRLRCSSRAGLIQRPHSASVQALRIACLMPVIISQATAQRSIVASPFDSTVIVERYGEVLSVARVFVSVLQNPEAHVKFKLDSVTTTLSAPNFLVVSPSSGETPAWVYIAANPNVIKTLPARRLGAQLHFVSVDETPASAAGASVALEFRNPPAPVIREVTNSASGQPGLAPGGRVSIRGENLAPPLEALEYDSSGVYPTSYGTSPNFITVTVNGTPAPLLYLSPELIEIIAPAALAGQKTAVVVVNRYSPSSEPFVAAVTDVAPGLFAAAPPGSRDGAPMKYRFPDYSRVSPDNPLEPGGVVVLFATGFGIWPDVPDGAISLLARSYTAQPVSLTIGGQPARLYYAGVAPFRAGMIQINAYVPEGLASGPQPVVLRVGEADNAAQHYLLPVR